MIGTNLILTIEGKKYSKKSNAEEYAKIAGKVTLFNKTKSNRLKEDIIKIMSAKAVAVKKEKEKEEAKIKGEKALIKKKIKEDLSNEDILKSLSAKIDAGSLSKEEEVELKELARKIGALEQPKPVATTPRRGEY